MIERKPPKPLRTEYRVRKHLKTRKNQNVFRNQNDELEVNPYPKTKKNIENPKLKILDCASCNQNICIAYTCGYYVPGCVFSVYKQKHQKQKKYLDTIRVFLPDYRMLIEGLKKFVFLWFLLNIIQKEHEY